MRKYWGLVVILAVMLLAVACAPEENGQVDGANGEKKGDGEVFTFAMSGLYPPFNYQDSGKLTGFDVEVGSALAEKMGMKPEPVSNPWQTILAALESGKFDAIIGSMAITKEREKKVDFSDPYYESGAQIFVSHKNSSIKKADDLKGKEIGVVVSSSFEKVAKEYTDKVVTYDSDVTALQDLLVDGRLDAVITDELVGKHAINHNGLKVKPIGDPLYTDKMAIAVQKGNKQLLEKINKALKEIIEDGTHAKISEKYFGENILN